jgi:SAM-dependent methyltransferase
LADSIISGITKVVNEYGKVIVLEDDIVTSPYFLKFMNDALNFYENKEKVWHISGWNYPIEGDGLDDVFLYRLMNCWGWATWADRWQHFEKDTDKLIGEFTKEDIKRFNLDGVEDFFGQVIANYEKKINTWAIFWYATIFKKDGLCLNPTQTFVKNIGNDSSGTHCVASTIYTNTNTDTNTINNNFNVRVIENNEFTEKIKDFYKMNKTSNWQKFINFLKKIYQNEQFTPSLLGIVLNPFYFSRKSLDEALRKLIPKLKGITVDIGCGSKPYEKFTNADKYIGLELDNELSKELKSADYYYDGITIPFDNNSTDSVLISQVFEHVFTPNELLQEINRILKSGGILLMSVPLVWDEHEQPYDYGRYTSYGLRYILNKNGFEVIELIKTSNDFTAIVQLVVAFIYKTTLTKNKYINLLTTMIIIFPINIIGLLISKLLPKNDDFYLDNVVLAKKIK